MKATHLVTIAAGIASLVFLAEPARADLVIKKPGDHPKYVVELEPHGDIVLFHPGYGLYGNRAYYYDCGKGQRCLAYYDSPGFSDPEFGAGFRASIKLMDPGFVPSINDAIAITFGVDVTNCRFCATGYGFSLWTPVALQWNFFLTDKWSVFAELGVNPRTEGFYHHVYFDFMGELGGRFHFTDRVALTMRLGYPFISVGASFFI